MDTEFCPHCRQPMGNVVRHGVRLTPLKARIFDVVKRGRYSGVTSDTINERVFGGRTKSVNIRIHIHQINDLMEEAGIRIYGNIVRGLWIMRP